MEYQVPYGLKVSVRITLQGDTKVVDVLAPMYLRVEWRTSFSFSHTFSDDEILKSHELVTTLLRAYGK